MKSIPPLAFGCVGLRGYGAAAIAALLQEQSDSAPPTARLVAACDVDLSANSKRAAELRSHGVRVYQRLEELLGDEQCEAVWLPVPIDLHRPFTEQSLAAGKAVLCEKPAAGCIDDVDAMIAARDHSGLPVAVGFQSIYLPEIQQVKLRMLEGDIGSIQRATIIACWPRDSRYYQRNNWAGSTKHNGRWVLDSPANNAASHSINQTLFLMGHTLAESAQPIMVEAELYRANPIENYDTCALRITLKGGAVVLVYMTHACRGAAEGMIRITGTKGALECPYGQPMELITPSGTERLGQESPSLKEMVRGFSRWARGDRTQIVSTLEGARAHALVISGASDAARVHSLGSEIVRTTKTEAGHVSREIPGIKQLCRTCAERGELFHESNEAAWSQPGGRKNLEGYRHFSGELLSNA